MMVPVEASGARVERHCCSTREQCRWGYPQRVLGAPGGSPEGPRALGAPRAESPAVDNPVRGILPARGLKRLAKGSVEVPVRQPSRKTPSVPSRHTTPSRGIDNGLGPLGPGPRVAPDGPACMLERNGGSYEVSWHRRSQPRKCVVLARRTGRGGEPGGDRNPCAGQAVRCSPRRLGSVLEEMLRSADGVDAYVAEMIEMVERQRERLDGELQVVEAELRRRAREIDAIKRLQTIPAIGPLTATTIYAWVGDVGRFPNAKVLGAYAGLTPSVRQSGEHTWMGSITKTGSPQLRHTLVQAAHVLIARSRGKEAAPLQDIAARVRGSRGRRKIAVVALARHLLRIAYYILRDRTVYDASRLRSSEEDRAVA